MNTPKPESTATLAGEQERSLKLRKTLITEISLGVPGTWAWTKIFDPLK